VKLPFLRSLYMPFVPVSITLPKRCTTDLMKRLNEYYNEACDSIQSSVDILFIVVSQAAKL
jgi:hypothetical protein